MSAKDKQPQNSQHPPQSRIFHSVNIAAVMLMSTSGLQIYNATPVLGGKSGWQIPNAFVLGGWLAGGRHWHFAVMWLFALNLIWYLGYVFWSKRWATRYANQSDLRGLFQSNLTAKRRLYATHKIAYTSVIPVMVLALLSGLALYKPVQFDWLANATGSWQNLRVIHFVSVPLVVVFTIAHSILGIKVGGWRLVRSIFWR
jgi:thiosulfate reductase cytochrome b subunit